MRILGYVPFAWPQQRGGSEVTMHRILRWLAAEGHEVRCIVTQHRGLPSDGVLYARRDSRGIRDWWRWADVVVTQHTGSTMAVDISEEVGTPVAHVAHNWHHLDAHPEMRPDADLMVWNSHALATALADQWPGRSVVVRPPVFPDEYDVPSGSLVAQVNLSALKGGRLFWQVAKQLRAVDFLAVTGGWGPQVTADGTEVKHAIASKLMAAAAPRNVTVVPTTTDMAGDVYARTRVLMMPTGRVSEAQAGESYGLVAAEAACCGIPVLATRSPGTEEALGDAGIWCDPENPAEWVEQIERLTDDAEWAAAHERSLAWAKQLDPTGDLRALERALGDLAGVAVAA